ncbi:hypothetical protein F5882DRAFT_110618 [Hyaloscypha sp. PMI_1271]|nr:hypothetical protein F5882DRAFT_110618 [Hyaloscypha sp. PMI_1271]
MAGALFGFDCLWPWWLGSSAAMRRHVDCRGTQHPMQSCKANLFRNGKDKLFSSTARSPVMAVVMRLWEERSVCKGRESRLPTLDMRIQDQLRCWHLNP